MSKKRLRDSKELLSQPRCDEAGLSADTAADDKYSRQSVDTFSSSLDDVISLRSAIIVIVLQILPSDVHMSAPAPRLLVPVSEAAMSPLARCCEVCRVLLYVALAAAESVAWIQLYNSNHL